MLLVSGCGGGGNDPPAPPTPSNNVAPAFTSQPVDQAVTEPGGATFSAAASGSPAPTLQWQSSTDGVTYTNLPGATSGTYDSGATTVAHSGRRYRVVATNVAGTATSNAATLTVSPIPDASPAITTQPQSQTVTAPASATFTALASGTPAPAYQWQSSTDGVAFADIAGATGSSFTTPATNLSQSGSVYRVVAANSAGSATSNLAMLTVVSASTMPSITTQPADQSVSEPDAATFTVVASGNPAPTYQWQLSTDGTTYNDVAGATSASHSTGPTTSAQTGHRYRVVVSNSAGSVTSDSVQLSVGAAASGATIVYSRNNGNVNVSNYDLYSIRENGGVETALATSSGDEQFCGVTPAGRVIYQVVVGGQFDIHSVNADGTDARVLANTSDNEFCSFIVPTGAAAGRLIYRRVTSTSSDLYAVNADGTLTRALANGPFNEGFAALTESNRVVFGVDTPSGADVYSVDLEGLSVIPLATSSDNEGFQGAAAGLVVIGRAAFGQGDLYVVGEAGTGFGPLAADPQHDESLAGITPGGAFVIKSRHLTTNARSLSAGGIPLASDAGDILYAGSSSTHVAYAKYVGNQIDTFAVRIDGTQSATLGDSADTEVVVFLTNDNRAFYERYAITGGAVTLGDVYLIDIDGTNRVPLAVSADNESFAALVGNRLLYKREIANSVNNIQLWSINLDGTGNARVLNVGGPSFFSAVTPSGKVLIRNYTGINNIYLANPDGTGARLVMGNATFLAVFQ